MPNGPVSKQLKQLENVLGRKLKQLKRDNKRTRVKITKDYIKIIKKTRLMRSKFNEKKEIQDYNDRILESNN